MVRKAIWYVTQAYFISEHTIDFCVVEVFMVLLETKKKFLKLTKRPWGRNDYIPNEQRFSFFVWNGERFPLLLETNNAFRIVTQTYFNSEHTINFCVVEVFMVLVETKKKFLKLTKRPWVRNDYIPNEQRFSLLLETSNVTLRNE